MQNGGKCTCLPGIILAVRGLLVKMLITLDMNRMVYFNHILHTNTQVCKTVTSLCQDLFVATPVTVLYTYVSIMLK